VGCGIDKELSGVSSLSTGHAKPLANVPCRRRMTGLQPSGA
jgi:hypothetical protein